MSSDEEHTQPAAKRRRFDPANLLKKQGWSEGEGLGREGQGRSTYVAVSKKQGTYGLGADRSVFVESERKQFAFLLDDALAKVNRDMKSKNKKRKRAASSSDDEAPAPKAPAAEKKPAEKTESKFALSTTRMVDGTLVEEDGATKKPVVEDSDSDSDDSSSNGGGPVSISVLTDNDLFSACGGARFGKLGRHSNNKEKIARIREMERVEGAKLVAESRKRWNLKKRGGTVSPHRSPKVAPTRSPKAAPARSPAAAPARSPATTPRAAKKEKKAAAAEEVPAKKEKKQKKEKKAAVEEPPAEKKEKKSKKDKKEKK